MAVVLEKHPERAVETGFGVTAQAKSKGATKKVEDDDAIDEDVPAKGAATKKGAAAEDDDDDPEDSDSDRDDDDWDPDFDEFDVPKSRGGKGAKEDEEEDFKPEEEEDFKDMDLFNDSVLDEEEDDF